MRKISPICSATAFGSDPHEWTPSNFDDFLEELQHIIGSCPGNNPLFRGHANRKWLLESTFVRTCKKILLDLEPHVRPSEQVRESFEYNGVLLGLLLLKYDVLIQLDDVFHELRVLEETHDIDALFELMKKYQQYPEKDKTTLRGTFFLDWSQDKNVGLYFANYDANEQSIRFRHGDGALFICDKTATGKTLMRRNGEPIRVQEIIDRMVKAINENKRFGCPLLFYPPKQRLDKRGNKQCAIYWAQMDLAYDLEEIWKLKEKDKKKDEYIFIKLILPNGTQKECEDYLNNQSPPITHRDIFPEERN